MPRLLYPQGKDPGTYWTGGWVGPTVSLDAVVRRKNTCLCWESNSRHPAHSLIIMLTQLKISPSSLSKLTATLGKTQMTKMKLLLLLQLLLFLLLLSPPPPGDIMSKLTSSQK
jgi:hypothetical protein